MSRLFLIFLLIIFPDYDKMSEKDGDYMKYICEFFSASDRTDGGIYRMALTETLDFIRISKIDLAESAMDRV